MSLKASEATLSCSFKENPIDLVESIFNNKSFELERRSINEIAIEVKTTNSNMVLFFAWEEHIKCMHLSCLIDIENPNPDNYKIYELLALINAELWLGHFSYWKEENMPIFKHSIILNDFEDISFEKISKIINIAIKECERMYPIFKTVLIHNVEPEQALYPLNMITIGNA